MIVFDPSPTHERLKAPAGTYDFEIVFLERYHRMPWEVGYLDPAFVTELCAFWEAQATHSEWLQNKSAYEAEKERLRNDKTWHLK